jgi:hypothetical protein
VFLLTLVFIWFLGTYWSPDARELGVASSSQAYSFNIHNLRSLYVTIATIIVRGCLIVVHGRNGLAVAMMFFFLFCRFVGL